MQKILLKDLPTLAQNTLEALRVAPAKESATILALVGELGAGKTTFVQALAKELGIQNIIQSPTYVLMKRYDISYRDFTHLIHIDAYRLNNAKEFTALRPEEFLSNPQNLVCIEWPELVKGALPKPDLVINFSSKDAGEGERYIEVI